MTIRLVKTKKGYNEKPDPGLVAIKGGEVFFGSLSFCSFDCIFEAGELESRFFNEKIKAHGGKIKKIPI